MKSIDIKIAIGNIDRCRDGSLLKKLRAYMRERHCRFASRSVEEALSTAYQSSNFYKGSRYALHRREFCELSLHFHNGSACPKINTSRQNSLGRPRHTLAAGTPCCRGPSHNANGCPLALLVRTKRCQAVAAMTCAFFLSDPDI